ncbi:MULTISPECIES: hypothetical protein [Paenibacillus]|nr:hypothetical protein [Paenibacillus sp. Pae15]
MSERIMTGTIYSIKRCYSISTAILMSKRIWLRSIAKFAEMRYII